MSEKLTNRQAERYIEMDGGVSCPYCDSSSLERKRAELEAGRMYQEVLCTACGKTWVDGYTFDSVGSGDGGDFAFQYPGEDTYCRPAVQRIHELLYLDSKDGRLFCNPDKEWDADTMAMVAEVIAQYIPRPDADAKQTPAAKIDGRPPDREPSVMILVIGGVADVMLKPKGVAVSIFDYDVQGEEHSTKDPDGRECCISEWPASKKVIGNRHWPIVKQAVRSIERRDARRWKCPDCGHVGNCSYEQLAEAGCPYCAHCDAETRLL